jgi:signal peptidase II
MKKSDLKWLLLSALLLAIDRISKFLIVQNIDLYSNITIIDKFFFISYIKNSGAAWGILQNGRPLFLVLTIIAVVVMFYLFFKTKYTLFKLSMVFLIPGALGNFIDRAIWGEVTDFLEFHFGSYIFPIFNFADICIVVGTIIMAIYLLFVSNSPMKDDKYL